MIISSIGNPANNGRILFMPLTEKTQRKQDLIDLGKRE